MQRNAMFGSLIVGLLLLGRLTAVAQDATPETAPDLDTPTVTGTREVSFAGRYLSMSPDGRWIATYDPEQDVLCALEVAALGQSGLPTDGDGSESCLSLETEGIRSIAEEYVRWSPDGSRLALTENGPVYLEDADIWVFTPETGEVINLSDDGVTGGLPVFSVDDDDEPFDMDILPAWSPDGRYIAFARSPWDGEWRGTQLMLVPSDGSAEAEVLAPVDITMPMIVYFGMGFSPDGASLYYTVGSPSPDDPNNGVWEISLDDLAFRHLAARTDPDRGFPTLAAVSPAGDQLLLYDVQYANQFGATDTAYALLDVETGEVEPMMASSPEAPHELVPVRATYSPDGEWILFGGTGTRVDSGLFIRPSSEAGPGQDQLLVDDPGGESPFIGVSWASNGTIFAQESAQSGFIFEISGGNDPPQIQLASDAPVSATPEASPVASGPLDPAVVETGTELVTNEAVVVLRSAPAPDAPVIAELAGGTMLVALGPAEEAGGFTWIPVREPDTGTIGYVRAELVSLAPAA